MPDRCPWAEKDELSRAYHDDRWCRPVHSERELFAMLELEGMQAGLSWSLILKRETAIRAACDGFDPAVCATYGPEKEAELLAMPQMIRSKAKIAAIGNNARTFLQVESEFGSFDSYIWGFTEGRTVDHHLRRQEDMPAQDALSQRVSRDLKKRGFKFAGPVIAYSYLQAIGVINDHLESCPFR